MKAILENPVLVALLTAFLMWIAGWVRSYLAKRVRNPDQEVINRLVPAVNLLIEMKEPELTLLIALGEAIQAENGMDVTDALKGAHGARNSYRNFLGKAACIEVGS